MSASDSNITDTNNQDSSSNQITILPNATDVKDDLYSEDESSHIINTGREEQSPFLENFSKTVDHSSS